MKRVGLMGCGRVAMYGHLPALADSPSLELAAIYDPDPGNLEKARERFDVPVACTDTDAFYEAGLDAVAVTSPAPCHHENVLEAARRGKHVLCEKPLAMTEIEAREMVDVMADAGLMLFTGFTYRFAPVNTKVKELLAQNVIGDVRSLRLIYIWNLHGRYELDEKGGRIEQRRRQGRMLEGGPMVDCGAHQIDLSRWWLQSEIINYTGIGAWLEEYEAPDHMYLHLDHACGAHTMVEISYSYCHTAKEPFHIYSYDLIGTEGVLRYSRDESVFEVRSSAGTQRYETGPDKNFEGMYAGFAKALETGETGDMPTGEDGLIATRIARAGTQQAIAHRGRVQREFAVRT